MSRRSIQGLALPLQVSNVGIDGVTVTNALLVRQGAISAPNSTLSIGAISAPSLVVVGAISGASCAVTGALTGASCAVTGALTGASCTLTGALGANSANVTNRVTADQFTSTGTVQFGQGLTVNGGAILANTGITSSNAINLASGIPGQGIVFSNLGSLPVAVNNAAAQAALVPVGGFYRTAADPAVVCVRTV